jgi:hypothetical protein
VARRACAATSDPLFAFEHGDGLGVAVEKADEVAHAADCARETRPRDRSLGRWRAA